MMRPWAALWTITVGFFMILIDTTIVSVATPAIMSGFAADASSAIWVTSGYLLAFAVPLLLGGRLGDRFGQRRVYLAGLAIFTVASLACGLAPTLGALIAARVVQGLGAALVAPQTMAVITRMFPAERRGQAMAVWGTTGGVASIAGPLAGGALVGTLGWPAIFWINVPIGVIGFVLALIFLPALPTTARRLDVVGVLVSAVAFFCIVFGVQESTDGDILRNAQPGALIGAGLVLLCVFVVLQRFTRRDPLMPLRLFAGRNFSLASFAMTAMGFSVTCMSLPLMIFAQWALGLSPIQSALMTVPMALMMVALGPVVGRLTGRADLRLLAGSGFVAGGAALVWIALALPTMTDVWGLVAPLTLFGIGASFIAAPISVAAMQDIPADLAGAGSGTFNSLRQTGAVLGSASVAALMTARLDGTLPSGGGATVHASLGIGAALGPVLLLPAAVLLTGMLSVLFLRSPSSDRK